MTTSTKTIIMMGLPAAGKTTFLAAFWHHVKHAPNTEMRVDVLPDDQRYLNLISGLWLEGKRQPHTNAAAMVRLNLRKNIQDEVALVCLPDASGETYQRHWANRRWDLEYDVIVKSLTGVALFVHPGQAGESPLIADVNAAAAAISGGSPEPTDVVATAVPWDAKSAPADTVLVECLQFLTGNPCYHGSLAVAVIISAWDSVSCLGKTPAEWLSSEMPLLSQFCENNSEYLKCRYYGISAQGGDFDNDASVNAILRQNDLQRAKACDSQGKAIGISQPISWLLETGANE